LVVLCFVFCVLCFVFCVLCFVFCVLCFVFCVLCFVLCSSGRLATSLVESWYQPKQSVQLLCKSNIKKYNKTLKHFLINYPHLSDYGQTIFCLSFPSRDRATAPRAIWTILLHRTCSLSTKNKFWGRNQIRLDPVQLFCNSFCVQHKMVGDDYPFILQCLVYHKKGTVHHWGILTHP
jgi:hypothetical protein